MGVIHLEAGEVLDTAALKRRGLSPKQVSRLVRQGRLHRVERGIFTTSEPAGILLLRALSHSRDNLVFTGRTAVEIYTGSEITEPVQGLVTTRQSTRSTSRLTLQARRSIRYRTVNGVKVATRLMGVADAEGLTDDALTTFLEAEFAGRQGRAQLEEELSLFRKVPARLRCLIAGASIGADSDAERRVFRELLRRGIHVEQNRQIGGYFFDGVIEEGRVIVEVDGYRFHSAENRETFIRDRWKANYATRRGYRVLRYTGSCVRYHLDEVVEQIIAAVEGLDEELPTEAHPVWSWHETMVRDGSWWQEVAQ